MRMFHRILLPLDGSTRAEQAIPLAARLARASGGALFLLRVVDNIHAAWIAPTPPLAAAYLQDLEDQQRAEAHAYLAEKTAASESAKKRKCSPGIEKEKRTESLAPEKSRKRGWYVCCLWSGTL